MTKRKLFLRLKGGIGNQLFIYSFGTFCEQNLGFDVYYDMFSGFFKDIYGSKPSLHKLGIRIKKTNFFQNLILILCRKKIFNHIDYINTEKKQNFEISKIKLKKNIFLEGYFQDIKYFDSTKNKILDKIKLINHDLNYSENNFDYNKSVCVHHRIEYYNYEIDKEFFKKSFEFFDSIIQNPTFYIFSDSIDASKKYFEFLKNKKVQFVDGGHSDIQDLYLMSKFKNFILTIGTFGIWAAILSENQNKVVVRPHENITNDKAYPSNWKRIKL